ncbi:MAG: signal peptidase I [Anaerorhabdus sp.]
MKNKIDIKKEIIEFIKLFAVCYLGVLIFTTFILKPIKVSQNSMYPTILDKSIGFSSVISKTIEGVDRFDVVIIEVEKKNFIIKRAIGLPNDTIEYKDNKLYINGEIIEEKFLYSDYYNSFTKDGGIFTEDFGPFTLGNDEVFCLGDNRPRSKDSRHYGPFNLSQVVSKDVFFIYPLSRFGGVN